MVNIKKELTTDVREKVLNDYERKHHKVRIIKDFEVDYVFLTKHPILKNSWKSEVLYEGQDYEGGNE